MVFVIKVLVRCCYACYYQTEKPDNNLNYRYHLHNGKLRRSRIKSHLNDFKVLVLYIIVQIQLRPRFKRRTVLVPNPMLMSENNRFCSLALDSAHVKFDV